MSAIPTTSAAERVRPSARGSMTHRRLVGAVLLSRAIAYCAGIASALLVARVPGWTQADPIRISQSFGSLGNVLAAPAVRWDGAGYLTIAEHGYRHAGQTILFPLYPLATAALGWLLRSDVIAGMLISAVSFGVGLTLLHRLTELELGERAADAAVLVLAFAPVSLFFTATYSESLFLAVSVGAVYAARRDRIALAALLCALATVTRITGILLVVPIGLLALQQTRAGQAGRRAYLPQTVRRLAWLALAPAALLGFLAYMQARGYGWLAPFNNQTAHTFAGPLSTVAAAISAATRGLSATLSGTSPLSPTLESPFSPGFDSVILLLVLAVAAWALVLALRRLPLAYSSYAALTLLVCIFSQTKLQPLESLDRYTLTIFPLWMAAGAWLVERRAVRAAVIVGGLLLAFYSWEFATWAFIA